MQLFTVGAESVKLP
ncbi:Protein of unknown function [Lactobacillus helveticus CIRM-BIA 104]|uniref:Uncharacterized protein n=1 Tax=Lactobacillus helveticus CIRM-BIA 104 TaxID=1226333 RepID=U6F964_LACHE|nr:Protein of unknown function [Lactobacillus helveticus CIRM-BIA 104]